MSAHLTDFAWAIIGPGRIAHWCRSGKPSPRAVANLSSLLADDTLDAVYIATPHSAHAPFIRECLAAGKPVLCEKPLVPTRALAQELVALSQERGVFLMEAFWSRFLPVYAHVGDWLGNGAIGRVRAIQSSFCFTVPCDPGSRLFSAALAGGSLLDIGIYNLAMTRWVLESALGACPEPLRLDVEGVLAPTGVDQRAAATMEFPDGILAQLLCAFDCVADSSLRVFGDAGCISVPQRFWEATDAVLTPLDGALQTVHEPFRFNGFEYEIEEAIRCVCTR